MTSDDQRAALGFGLSPMAPARSDVNDMPLMPSRGACRLFVLIKTGHDLLDNYGRDGKADTDRYTQGRNNGRGHADHQTTIFTRNPPELPGLIGASV